MYQEGGYPEVVLESSRVMKDKDTRDRELGGIREAATVTGCLKRTIVTHDQDEVVHDDLGPIRILPAWKWFLE